MRRFFVILVAGFLWTVMAHSEGETDVAPAAASGGKKQRNYPGGRDEEDLRVQETPRSPTQVTDRTQMNKMVLRNYFKKTGIEVGPAEEVEMGPEESESESQ